MKNLYYVLDGHNPVPADIFEAEKFFNDPARIVAQEQVGKYFVSTVFLVIDHNFWPIGDPRLFETMVFDGDREVGGFTQRYMSWEDAEKGHVETVLGIWAQIQGKTKKGGCKK